MFDAVKKKICLLIMAIVILPCSAIAAEYDVAAHKGLTSPPVWVEFSQSYGGLTHRYSVWGGNTFIDGYDCYDPQEHGYTLLGYATGTQTFSGAYDYYIILADKGCYALVESMQGSDKEYFTATGVTYRSGGTSMPNNCLGSPNYLYSILGGIGYGNNGGYILFDAHLKSLTGITVLISDDPYMGPLNLTKSGWSLHTRGEYILETTYTYSTVGSSWKAKSTIVWKLDDNNYLLAGKIFHDTKTIYPATELIPIPRRMNVGESKCVQGGGLTYCTTLTSDAAAAPTKSGPVGSCIAVSNYILGPDIDPELVTEIYKNGKMYQKQAILAELNGRNNLVSAQSFAQVVTDSGEVLSSAPFYSCMSKVDYNFDYLRFQLPKKTAAPPVRGVIIPIF